QDRLAPPRRERSHALSHDRRALRRSGLRQAGRRRSLEARDAPAGERERAVEEAPLVGDDGELRPHLLVLLAPVEAREGVPLQAHRAARDLREGAGVVGAQVIEEAPQLLEDERRLLRRRSAADVRDPLIAEELDPVAGLAHAPAEVPLLVVEEEV